MTSEQSLKFDQINLVDNPAIKGQEDKYKTVTIDVTAVIKDWRSSLFAHSWVNPDGRMKTLEELSQVEQERRHEVEERLASGNAIERPILGIGLLDHVEIGSGRSIFVTLAAHEIEQLSVHIRLSNEEELQKFFV